FTISDLGVTHRDATYWDKKDILPTLKTKNTTRRKYTLKQAIWIKLIQQLRAFDVSLNQIKKYKDCILNEGLSASEAMENEQVALIVEELAKKAGHLKEYKELLKDPSFLESLKSETLDIFETIVLYAIVFKRDASYIVFQEGQCIPYCFDKHQYFVENIENFDYFMKSPHLVLSISQAISQLIQDWYEKDWFEDVSIVSKEEKEILNLLRQDRTTELQIFKKDNKPDRVIQVSKNKVDAIEDFTNHIIGNGFQKITVNTRQGKIVSFKNEVSLKLKK
ncbi:MAG: MerR family transcriptional regulator, partial [Crocinitomicaceae bacterium]|nr:MerR family transcriptional regulator [Crocinitomicaceae bacterium]